MKVLKFGVLLVLTAVAMLGQAAVATAATMEIKLTQTAAGKTSLDPAGVRITAYSISAIAEITQKGIMRVP